MSACAAISIWASIAISTSTTMGYARHRDNFEGWLEYLKGSWTMSATLPDERVPNGGNATAQIDRVRNVPAISFRSVWQGNRSVLHFLYWDPEESAVVFLWFKGDETDKFVFHHVGNDSLRGILKQWVAAKPQEEVQAQMIRSSKNEFRIELMKDDGQTVALTITFRRMDQPK